MDGLEQWKINTKFIVRQVMTNNVYLYFAGILLIMKVLMYGIR